MRTQGRDHSGAEYLRLVAVQEDCGFCGKRLAICETRERYVQTLSKLLHVEGKGKKCVSPDCGHGELRYRSPEVGRLVLKGHEFGRDVVIWAGDQYIREKLSIPRIHKRLVGDFVVPISERSVGRRMTKSWRVEQRKRSWPCERCSARSSDASRKSHSAVE